MSLVPTAGESNGGESLKTSQVSASTATRKNRVTSKPSRKRTNMNRHLNPRAYLRPCTKRALQLTHSITSPWDGHPNFPPVFNLLSSSQCKTPRVFHLFPLFFSTISGLRELTRLTVLSQVWPDSLLLLAAWWSSRTVARCGCVERWSTCHTLAAVRVPPHA